MVELREVKVIQFTHPDRQSSSKPVILKLSFSPLVSRSDEIKLLYSRLVEKADKGEFIYAIHVFASRTFPYRNSAREPVPQWSPVDGPVGLSKTSKTSDYLELPYPTEDIEASIHKLTKFLLGAQVVDQTIGQYAPRNTDTEKSKLSLSLNVTLDGNYTSTEIIELLKTKAILGKACTITLPATKVSPPVDKIEHILDVASSIGVTAQELKEALMSRKIPGLPDNGNVIGHDRVSYIEQLRERCRKLEEDHGHDRVSYIEQLRERCRKIEEGHGHDRVSYIEQLRERCRKIEEGHGHGSHYPPLTEDETRGRRLERELPGSVRDPTSRGSHKTEQPSASAGSLTLSVPELHLGSPFVQLSPAPSAAMGTAPSSGLTLKSVPLVVPAAAESSGSKAKRREPSPSSETLKAIYEAEQAIRKQANLAACEVRYLDPEIDPDAKEPSEFLTQLRETKPELFVLPFDDAAASETKLSFAKKCLDTFFDQYSKYVEDNGCSVEEKGLTNFGLDFFPEEKEPNTKAGKIKEAKKQEKAAFERVMAEMNGSFTDVLLGEEGMFKTLEDGLDCVWFEFREYVKAIEDLRAAEKKLEMLEANEDTESVQEEVQT